MTFRPMLSATIEDLSKVRLPVLASPKLDGIRAYVSAGVVVSRNGKAIPSKWVQEHFGLLSFESLDGELICGDPTAPDCFRRTTSAVMSKDTDLTVKYHVFDFIESGDYKTRSESLRLLAEYSPDIEIVPQTLLCTVGEIEQYEEAMLAQGFEGVMLRDPYGMYKMGRSTMAEQWLMKLKRFEDAEAVVIGVEERMHNGNEATIDALGYTERSSHKENLIGRADLGALIVKDTKTGVDFNIGTGFDDADRLRLWQSPPIGQTVKYKYFPSGSKDKPRFPVFLGFRKDL